ncbi:MAG: single-stranded DNA-binding protein, partial [Planctomycetaceae bacterium]|nr:single-stranded DNA-binding protein [Planctomycetaceae bacterium]
MSSFNKVIVMGNLTRTPELRSTPGGTQVCDITVAVNENWTDQGGKAQERVTFVDVTVWGKTAETVCRWKKQGDAVLIEGRLQQDKWVDKESGKNRSKLKVVAENVRFVGSKGGGEGQGSGAGGQRGQASRGQPASRGQS